MNDTVNAILPARCEAPLVAELRGKDHPRGKYEFWAPMPELKEEAVQWFDENLVGDYELTPQANMRFSHDADYVLYKLRWIG